MPFNIFTANKKPGNATKVSLLLWQDHEVTVSRKVMKSIRLKVTPSGELKLSCPHFVSDPELLSFLNERQQWITDQQQKLAAAKSEQESSVAPGHMLLWGEQRLISSMLDQPLEHLNEQQIKYLQQEIQRIELKSYIAGHLPLWQERMGVQANFWNVKAMKTKWGSCNVQKKRIWLNLQLASYPSACAQMVLVHELVHLLEPSHNKRFYQLMDTHLPDWRNADEILKKIRL